MNTNILNMFIEAVGESCVSVSEPMAKHTTFRVGGPADYFVSPNTLEGVKNALDICKKENLPYYIIGNGSNLLISDEGYRGVIIQIYKNLNEVAIENGNVIRAQAGALLSTVARTALNHELTGMECLSGIPGTLGGAVTMNAGAYGGELKDVLTEVTVIDEDGQIRTILAEDLELGYRTSIIAKKGYVVLEAVLTLEKGDVEKIQARMDELKEQRVTKQPLEFPSAGSTFKRPEGYFAGKLIQDAGLAGYTVGGAQVSPKHCGFVVNVGKATASDVYQLICDVKRIILEKDQVELEPEVKMLGEFTKEE